MDRREPTPDSLLDSLRDHPDWDDARREGVFEQLIISFPRDVLAEAARRRVEDLGGADAEAVLRLVAADGSTELLGALADALNVQLDLAPELLWEALELLEGANLLDEFPELEERRDELAEVLEEDAIEELIELLECEPGEAHAIVQGLGSIEPDVRGEIVADLLSRSLPSHVADLLQGHSDESTGTDLAPWSPSRPRLTRTLVTAVDGKGRGQVVLVAEDRGEWVAAAFTIDVLEGVREVVGIAFPDPEPASMFLAGYAARPETDAIEDTHELAIRLLAGSLMMNDPGAPESLPHWLDRTIGPNLKARPVLDPIEQMADPDQLDASEVAELARAVLDAVPDWRDDSELASELADEIRLREGGSLPDPIRDSGAFRFLFEHRLRDRLELDRRMLLWMAAFWRASGAKGLAQAARSLAGQLADPQHVVPGHPFVVELARRSLTTRGPRGPAAGVLGDGGPSPGPRSLDA